MSENVDIKNLIAQGLSVGDDGVLRFAGSPVWLIPAFGSSPLLKRSLIDRFGWDVSVNIGYIFGRHFAAPMLNIGEGKGDALFVSVVTRGFPVAGLGKARVVRVDVSTGTAEVELTGGYHVAPGLLGAGAEMKGYCNIHRGFLSAVMEHITAQSGPPLQIVAVETACQLTGSDCCRFVVGTKKYLAEKGIVLEDTTPDIVKSLQASFHTAQEGEALYRMLVDSLHDFIFVIDNSLVLRYLNAYWYQEMGYDTSVVGRPMTFIVHPDDLGSVVAAAEKVRAGETAEVEYRALRKDGTYRYHRGRVVPLRGSDGKIEKGLGISRDVTEEREHRRRMDVLNAFRQSVVDNTNVLILAVDIDGNVTTFNKAMERLTGYPGDAIVGKHIRMLLPKSAGTWVEATLADHFRETDLSEWDLHVQASDGSIKVCRMSPSIVKADAQVLGVVQIGRDVTAEVLKERSEVHVAEIEQELETLRRELEDRYQFSNIVARASKMRQVFETIVAVSDSTATVLIQGETGTGKALVARAIHYNSSRKDKPFVEVDCGALTETLLESELFGHVRGAFTGAVRDKMGRFELAHGGTIFLDEIANLSLPLQVKLLRAVQEGKFERVGGVETISVDVRIVVATNEELSKMVDEGRFRKDLFYRLNVIPIHLPPLRERREDIPILVMHFLKHFAQKNNRNVEGVSRDAMDRLANYNWPGNVRELENLVEQAVVLARGPIVEVDDLRLPVSQPRYMWEPGLEVDTVPLSKVVEGPERAYIVEILRKFGGNKRKTAEILGLSRSMLYNKLRQYDVKAHEYS